MSPHDQPSGNSHYWDLLEQAFSLVQKDDFAAAEAAFMAAEHQREISPGRVFLTEKLGDRLRLMLHRRDPGATAADSPGRWLQETGQFRQEFQKRADVMVREGLRLAGLRPEDEAETNQPVLERALFLVSRSRLFPSEPRSAVSLLKGIFRTGQKTGRPFDHQLVRHDLPLTEEDRLWLAAKGSDLLDAFIEQGGLIPGSPEAGEWARAILQILRREYFGSSSRLEAERSWLEAVSADRLLQQPGSCIVLYGQYLAQAPQAGTRTDEARLRLLEILANIDGLHLQVPRYQEALAALEPGLCGEGRQTSWRRKHALDCVGFRRPDIVGDQELAWASVGLEPDGSVGVVFWWDDQPRDVAFWRPGTEASDLDALLKRCGERIVAWSPAAVGCAAEQWEHPCGRHTVMGLAAALLEPLLPEGNFGLDDFLLLGLTEVGPWRRDWSERWGHPQLEPPRGNPTPASWRTRPAHQALSAGLLVLAMRTRLERADPSLRAGIRALGHRGDEAAWFLYELVGLGKPAVLALDETFAPWTLPLLWTRPGPWREREGVAEPGLAGDLQPDLGRNDLAIVTTGNCDSVMKAWGGDQAKWRVVWDRPDRARGMAFLAGNVLGPMTLIPPDGMVYDLGAALAMLDNLLSEARQGDPETVGLLPIFHWVRLVETHNGDLEDYIEIRNRTSCENEIYEAYGQVVRAVPRQAVADSGADGWSGQYIQRARKSGLVGGVGSALCLDKGALDARWGIFDGSDASWVFWDSAAVHRGLLRSGEGVVRNLHTLLYSRGHRHLSLLTGACWMPDVLGAYLEHLLQAYGHAYHLTLQDRRPPALKLVDQGIRPDARLLQSQALAAQAMWLQGQKEPRRLAVLVPQEDVQRRFWHDVARQDLPGIAIQSKFLEGVAGDAVFPAGLDVLVLPELPGIPEKFSAAATRTDPCAWAEMDVERRAWFELTLARCALELAGLMAGPWREVVVLDVRWCHMLWGRSRVCFDEPDTWSFTTAQQLAGAVDAQPVQLPDSGRASGPLASIPVAVNRWLGAHTELVAAPETPRVVAPQNITGGSSVILELGPSRNGWKPYADRVEMEREQGRLGTWMLMVSRTCDVRWSPVNERDHAPGCSVWHPGGFNQPPAAMVWVSPEQLADQDLLETIAQRPPVVIHVQDFAAWLPDAGHERHFAAMALRDLLQVHRRRLVLHAEQLDRLWSDFLTGLLGDRFQIVNPEHLTTALPVSAAGESRAEAPLSAGDESRAMGRRDWLLNRLLRGLRPLLTATRGADPGPSGLTSAHEQVSLKYLAWLSGLAEQEVALGIRVLRWALGVCGEHLPAVGVEGDLPGEPTMPPLREQSHAVLISHRYAELEHTLEKMGRDLAILVPLWFQGLAPGMRTWIDLELPPAGIDAADLLRLDALLGNWGYDGSRPGGLVYRGPGGILNTNLRWIGCDENAAGLTGELDARLERLQLRLSEMLDAAIETPGGFLVETGLREPGPRERDFLALGSALGFWRWLGPVSDQAVSLVDLLALADVAGKREHNPAWQLCAGLLGEAGGLDPAEDGSRGKDSASTSPLHGLRNLLSKEARSSTELQENITVVADAVAARKPGQLVLRGPAGTGRHETLVRGLALACGGRSLPPEVRVFCPDTAVAAHVSAEFLRWGQGMDYAVEIPDSGAVLSGQTGQLPATGAGQAIVLCEAQRFPADLRYKVSQLGRGRLLLVTVDPWASEETWENLFLTAPRPDQIRECFSQRRSSRRIWSAVRELFPAGRHFPAGAGSSVRGELSAEYAANLDQCLGRLFAEPVFSGPQAFLRVVAGVRSDLEYLGLSLGERGWSVVDEDKLEPWLTPGPREFLAIVTDLADSGRKPLCPRLIGGLEADSWSAWCAENRALVQQENLAGILDRLQGLGFLQEVMAHAPHRRRLHHLMRTWGPMGGEEFMATPLVAVALQLIHRELGIVVEADRHPTALLAQAGRLPGIWAPTLMYLCLGSEPVLRHYLHWSRVTTSLLVLYQERSPLPGAGRP